MQSLCYLLLWPRSQSHAVIQREEIYIDKSKNIGDRKKQISLVNSVLTLSNLSNSTTPWILSLLNVHLIWWYQCKSTVLMLNHFLKHKSQPKLSSFSKSTTFMLQEQNTITIVLLIYLNGKKKYITFNVSFTRGSNRSLGRQIKTEIYAMLNSWINGFSLREALDISSCLELAV